MIRTLENHNLVPSGHRSRNAQCGSHRLGTGVGKSHPFIAGQFAEQFGHLTRQRRLGPGYRVDVPYRNIGLLYREIEDTQSAREYLERAIAAARLEYDPGALPSALGSYATLLNDVGAAVQALDTTRQAMKIDARLGDKQGVALERLEAARALITLKRWSEAVITLLMVARGQIRPSRLAVPAPILPSLPVWAVMILVPACGSSLRQTVLIPGLL